MKNKKTKRVNGEWRKKEGLWFGKN
jgi:hypothetical protein